jgi:outer membrane receptor for ferrienterochelin and colicins
MYKLGNCSLRGSYAGGFRAPTLKEMYMNFYMGNIFMIYGNPDLKPESSHNFSLSAEYMKGNHNPTVTGFYNIIDNRITTAWNQALGGQVYTNMSRLQVAGVDANASGKYRCGISWRLSLKRARKSTAIPPPKTKIQRMVNAARKSASPMS